MNNQEKPITVGNITVSVAMQKAGSDFMAILYDASVTKCLGGNGGCETWEDFKSEYIGEDMDLIKLYVEDQTIDSTTAAYIAMERVRQKELQNDQSE